jgi:hypothetical protein
LQLVHFHQDAGGEVGAANQSRGGALGQEQSSARRNALFVAHKEGDFAQDFVG